MQTQNPQQYQKQPTAFRKKSKLHHFVFHNGTQPAFLALLHLISKILCITTTALVGSCFPSRDLEHASTSGTGAHITFLLADRHPLGLPKSYTLKHTALLPHLPPSTTNRKCFSLCQIPVVAPISIIHLSSDHVPCGITSITVSNSCVFCNVFICLCINMSYLPN